jgi:hypothetical protein
MEEEGFFCLQQQKQTHHHPRHVFPFEKRIDLWRSLYYTASSALRFAAWTCLLERFFFLSPWNEHISFSIEKICALYAHQVCHVSKHLPCVFSFLFFPPNTNGREKKKKKFILFFLDSFP